MLISSVIDFDRGTPITAEAFLQLGRNLVDLATELHERTPRLDFKLAYALASGGTMIRKVSELSLMKRWEDIDGEKILQAGARIDHPHDQKEFVLGFDPNHPTKLSIRFSVPYPSSKDISPIADRLLQTLGHDLK